MRPPEWLDDWFTRQSRGRLALWIFGGGGTVIAAAGVYNDMFLPKSDQFDRMLVYCLFPLLVALTCALLIMMLERWIVRPAAYNLLRTYYRLTSNAAPHHSACIAYRTCLARGGYAHVFEAARIFIEFRLWGVERDDESAFVELLIERLASGKPMESADELHVRNCFVLTDQEEVIGKYFQSVQLARPNDPRRDRFLTEAIIERGYVAPQQLLDGLLTTYGESWDLLISEFLHESHEDAGEFAKTGFKRTQMFVFYCWLLWGPSVPIGRCLQWRRKGKESLVALQYGFGDENNSLPLFPLVYDDEDDRQFERLVRYVESSPFALDITLKVRPVFVSANLKLCSAEVAKNVQRLGNAQRSIWRFSASRRSGTLALDYSVAPNLTLTENSQPDDPRQYYSAYIWIMFVLVDRDTRQPVFPAQLVDGGSSGLGIQGQKPWNGMFPFFEHGNIADDTTYAIFKQQLAHKSLASISSLLNETLDSHPDDPRRGRAAAPLVRDRFRFQYVCASDDANCVDPNCAPAFDGSRFHSATRIRDYVSSLLDLQDPQFRAAAERSRTDRDRGRFANLREHVILDNEKWSRQDHEAFSACHLPEVIELLYDHLGQPDRHES